MRRKSINNDLPCQNLIVYWTFRAVFFTYKWWKNLIFDEYSLSNFEYILELALGNYITIKDEGRATVRIIFDEEKLFADAPQLLKKLKRKAWNIDPEFKRNLNRIQKIFGLTKEEKIFLAFITLMEVVHCFESLIDFFGPVTMSDCVEKLSPILDIKKEKLNKIISYNSILFKTGLISFNNGNSISRKFTILPEFVTELFLPHGNPEEIFQNYLKKAIKTRFTKEDFSHIENFNTLVSNLKNALNKRSQRGRLLFYGPPGTGKTEFARKIAFYLNKELLLKRASDLISPYVGETEVNIARMFKEARREKAVLLLDEADTFLLSRKDAKYSWEVSMVNELLTQMEVFEGVFICATNFVDALDEAVMRRFDLKVKFEYLNATQAVKLFASLVGESEAEKYRKVLSKLLLTPGNFATVYRRLKLLGEDFSPENFVKALKEEARFNQFSGKKQFGFV